MALTIDLSAGGGLQGNCSNEELGTPDGRLSFKRKLGQGAEGSVYIAVPSKRGGYSNTPVNRRGTKSQPEHRRSEQSSSSSSSRLLTTRVPVAVKVVTGNAFQRYRETRCLWPSLRHPNIVFPTKALFDEPNRRCFLEMELCEIDLLDLVERDGPLSEARGALFAGNLASGLAHCHSQGIAHQDVKLENTFLRHGVAKLGDLGSIRQVVATVPQQETPEETPQTASPARGHSEAKRNSEKLSPELGLSSAHGMMGAGRITASASAAAFSASPFAGSPQYAPPEAFQSTSLFTAGGLLQPSTGYGAAPPCDPFAGDVWSLGIVLYAAVAGCLPWEKACVHRSAEFRRFVEAGAEGFFPRSFSPGLTHLLSQMLSVDQKKRPTAAEILRSDPWVTTPPITPPSLSSSPSARQTGNTHSWSLVTSTTAPAGVRPVPVTPTEVVTPTSSTATPAAAAAGRSATTFPVNPNSSPIPLFATAPTSTVLHKRVACGEGTAAIRGPKRARLSSDGRDTAGADADAVAGDGGEGLTIFAALRDVGSSVAVDINNSSPPSPARPRERPMASPLLQFTELESKDIMGGSGVPSSGVALEGEEVRSTDDRGEVQSVTRVTPSPSPRGFPPQWALRSVEHHSSRTECRDLPKFVMLDPLRKPGMKRPVPTGGSGGDDLGGVQEDRAELSSKRAFKRLRPSGGTTKPGCSDAGFARVGFKLRVPRDSNAAGGECT